MPPNDSSGEIPLSACLIVRNEERFLEGCLRSLKDAADEIIVVDTGSTDHTLSIARRFTDAICSIPWRNDFPGPPNTTLEKARGRWILSIDSDERVHPIFR